MKVINQAFISFSSLRLLSSLRLSINHHARRALKMKEELGDLSGIAISLHQIGIIYHERGEYEKVFEYYARSLKMTEELGDRSGIASSLGQIGKLFAEVGHYDEGFQHFLSALSIFIELQSPNAKIIVSNLKVLRAKWGEENFDAAWKEATGEDVPDWLLDETLGET